MPTNNPRINITFDPTIMNLVTNLAKKEQLSTASFARELILEALERREDKALSTLAETRDKKIAKRKSHSDAWK